MRLLPWLLIVVGVSGAVTTRLGWYDEGGPIRRLDWFGLYGFLQRSWVGGGVRRANYAISAMLIVLGAIALLGPVLVR
jgi:hypothetical protein